MGRMRTLFCGLLATSVAGTVLAVSGASAAPPEFGRCVKVATGTGTYATATCATAGGEKKFEWLPGPGPKPGFSVAWKSGTTLRIEGVTTKAPIRCFGATGSGEITGPQSIGVTITLTGCEPSSFKCTTPGLEEGEIRMSGFTGELGVVKAGVTHATDQVGLTLSGKTEFDCPLIQAVMSGSAIGLPGPKGMSTAKTWTFKIGSKAQQLPERLEGGLPETFETSFNAGTPEMTGLAMTVVLTLAEKVEINTVV